ncbi:hypothetical protein TNCV_3917121 [Trichonephila clavipes]|nr:hypothetical protein TNCV_3917121 [Trichonephila clavipes]
MKFCLVFEWHQWFSGEVWNRMDAQVDSIRTNISIRWLTSTGMAEGRSLHLADDFKPLQFFLKKSLTVEKKSRI